MKDEPPVQVFAAVIYLPCKPPKNHFSYTGYGTEASWTLLVESKEKRISAVPIGIVTDNFLILLFLLSFKVTLVFSMQWQRSSKFTTEKH